jgi:hypothetical protein
MWNEEFRIYEAGVRIACKVTKSQVSRTLASFFLQEYLLRYYKFHNPGFYFAGGVFILYHHRV